MSILTEYYYLLHKSGDSCYTLYENGATDSCELTAFKRALEAKNIDEALSLLRSFLAKIPYDLSAKDEKQFQTILYMLCNSLNTHFQSEVRTSSGRLDFLLRIGANCYIFELKYNKSSKVAIKQIQEKNYALPYLHEANHITLVGVNYDPAQRTISKDWQIEQIK